MTRNAEIRALLLGLLDQVAISPYTPSGSVAHYRARIDALVPEESEQPHVCIDCRWYRPDQQKCGECAVPLPFWIMDRMDPPGVLESDGGDCQCFEPMRKNV